ncbi:MAG TPA: methionine gamma-lyase family protein [Candidatus Onthenecus intestinigallinarum]|uniref:Methionine gamma-lyase family protein n=1 Tax=Candidatus Onthenecus intestinigallinarum TaxID=2840875 RepID=A0A9D0ZBX7_9FIRM|nr:methionine gamma-lyase family protein [Candidatus Onthenecus intestinigallinarum]
MSEWTDAQEQRLRALIDGAQEDCAGRFAQLERIESENFERVLAAMQAQRVGVQHFQATTGYGYDDIGRDALERVFAQAFGAQDALVRPQFVSGTHALAVCLFGLLRPGDQLLSAVGMPYDTMDEVIGISRASDGSLAEMGVGYAQVELTGAGEIDLPAVCDAITDRTRVVMIQRSRGYAWRPALTVGQIGEAARAIHARKPDAIVMVDNCYGEFVDVQEPTHVGADVMVGSLIKNAGGGLAPTGGYIAGRHDLIERIACRLTSPGIGREVGSYAYGYQPFYQGFFFAPHVVCQAVKTAVLAAAVFSRLGFTVHPGVDDARSDIIQALRLETPERLIAFCEGIQMASPVDSFALPEPWAMPGYQDQVIMAAGTFVSGASIELSADAPMREPFAVYMQGGLTLSHGRAGIASAVRRMADKGLLTI